MKLWLIVLALALTMIGCMTNQSRKSEPAVAPANRAEELNRKIDVLHRDSVITEQITRSFTQAGFVYVRVRTQSGVVILCGNVATENQKHQAEEVAKSVSGVVTVANYITVSSPPVNTNKPGGPAEKPCDF